MIIILEKVHNCLKEILIVMNVTNLTKYFGIVREIHLKKTGCIYVTIAFV